MKTSRLGLTCSVVILLVGVYFVPALSSECWAASDWQGGECKKCPAPQGFQCPDFTWTTCYATKSECSGLVEPTNPPQTNPQATVKSTTTTKRTTSKKPATEQEEVADGSCWAPSDWQGGECKKCSAPQGNQCPEFSWTTCYTTQSKCSSESASSGGGSSGGCSQTCRTNTLDLTRPTFKGPSCYTSEFGSQFGPNWAPSGKTRFEHYITDPTMLYKMIQTTSDDLPWLTKTWNLKGCDAAAAVYENVVCAIEILMAKNKQFEGLKSGSPGYYITDFANTGDEQSDLRELAAFFSHQFKETARLQVWEETPSTAYTSCTTYPCGKSLYYHGRGPVQISWNYNYGPFSEWFYGDKYVLLDDPDKVDPEGPMGFIAKFWFWMTPRDFTSGQPISGSLRTRDAIIHWTDGKMNAMYNDGKDYDSVAGLGLSTNVINGGIECPPGSDSPTWRIMYYLTAAARIGADIPDMNNIEACKADKYCNGLGSGCTASANGVTCEKKSDTCGDKYVDGWTGELCKKR